MCFSATASLVAASALTIAGGYCIKKAQTKGDYVLAVIPLIFALQQLLEGLLWLYLSGKIYGMPPTCLSSGFIFVADVVWPFWVPLAVLMIEKQKIRKKILLGFLIAGSLLSLYLFINVFSGSITPKIKGQHILYNLNDVHLYAQVNYVYLSIIVTSFLTSSHRWVALYGTFVFAAYLLTDYIASETYVSVWCFFAAVLSLILCLHFRQRNKSG